MKLTDLNARFIGAGGEGVTKADGSPSPERTGVGIIFDCPCGCGDETLAQFDNPLDGKPKLEGRHPTWKRTGDTIETLTLRPSIKRTKNASECGWHGFITDGEAVGC